MKKLLFNFSILIISVFLVYTCDRGETNFDVIYDTAVTSSATLTCVVDDDNNYLNGVGNQKTEVTTTGGLDRMTIYDLTPGQSYYIHCLHDLDGNGYDTGDSFGTSITDYTAISNASVRVCVLMSTI